MTKLLPSFWFATTACAAEPADPPPLADPSVYAGVVVEQTVPGDVASLRAFMEEHPLITFTETLGNIPAVVGTEPIEGDFPEPESRRYVVLDDGNTAIDRSISVSLERFEYQVYGFTSGTARFVNHAWAEQTWEDGDGTVTMTWTYRMRPRIGLLRGAVRNRLERDFQPWMALAVDRLLTAYQER